jgi:hypothetical protein
MKYLEFTNKTPSHSGLTSLWDVASTVHGNVLGKIAWFSRWRQYCFLPFTDTVYSPDCLRDIADFCECKTMEHTSEPKQ